MFNKLLDHPTCLLNIITLRLQFLLFKTLNKNIKHIIKSIFLYT